MELYQKNMRIIKNTKNNRDVEAALQKYYRWIEHQTLSVDFPELGLIVDGIVDWEDYKFIQGCRKILTSRKYQDVEYVVKIQNLRLAIDAVNIFAEDKLNIKFSFGWGALFYAE